MSKNSNKMALYQHKRAVQTSRSSFFVKIASWLIRNATKGLANMHIEHFVIDGDCMGIQFPVTKTIQTGSGNDLILHFYDAPHKPYESVNLAFGKNMSLLSLCAEE